MTDAHTHLDLQKDPELSLRRAADFVALLTVGIDPRRNRQAVRFAEENANVYAAVGLHPTEAELLSPEVAEDLRALAAHPRIRAIGETGFDFYWDKASPGAQRAALDLQAELAQAQGHALVLHVRSKEGRDDAERELVGWLQANRPPRFVLHAFSGHEALLEVALELGGFVSLAGNLTHRKRKRLRELARELPKDRVVVETDAPYLTPEPKRGRDNQPAYAVYTLAELAELWGLPFHEVEAITDANAERLFRWKR